jgi:hypothetical protein
MDFEAANRKRDRRLRWSILRMLNNARALDGGMAARQLLESLDGALPPSDRFGDDDDRLMSLLKDLANAGYVELLDLRTHRSQKHSVDWINAAVTAKGTRFCDEGEAPDSLIDDGRIVKGAR